MVCRILRDAKRPRGSAHPSFAGEVLALALLAARTALVLAYAFGAAGLLCACLALLWQQAP